MDTVNVYGDPAECKCDCHIPYDPLSTLEIFTFHSRPCCGPELKGSRAETLPEMTAEQEDDIAYFQRNLRRGLGIPEPTMNESESE